MLIVRGVFCITQQGFDIRFVPGYAGTNIVPVGILRGGVQDGGVKQTPEICSEVLKHVAVVPISKGEISNLFRSRCKTGLSGVYIEA